MLTIRRFEERCLALRADGQIAGSIHLCCGQEAIPVGARLALRPEDQVMATYRGHGWAIAWGVSLASLLAEICQRAGGVNGGRAGSAYLTAPEVGFLAENSVVGAGVPIAAGAALAARLAGSDRVVVVSFGDGATSQGSLHEGIVFAAARHLPLLLVCENNGWSEMTPISSVARTEFLAERASGYGIPGIVVDGNDPEAVAQAVSTAAEAARNGEGPTFIECRTARLLGHYNADVEHYRPLVDKEAAAAADPLPQLRARLESEGVTLVEFERFEAEVAAEVSAAEIEGLGGSLPDPTTARDHVVAISRAPSITSLVSQPTTELTYGMALNEALRRELSDRPEVVVYGEDVAVPGGVFGVTRGLLNEFGAGRVFDAPIAESAILGSAVGASLNGALPIVEIMWSDFLLVALDQLVNQAANVRYVSRGRQGAPLVVRCQQGVSPGSCAQHSQSLEALLAHVPGLRVGLPSNAQDAYAMLRAAVADPDPCILIESRLLYPVKGHVALDAPVEPIGGARLVREGRDLTIITWGRMTGMVTEASAALEVEGIHATIIDLRWLAPLDLSTIGRAIAETSRVLIVHEANLTGGFGAEVAAWIAQHHFHDLDAPPVRLGAPDVRFPSAPVLQDALVPQAHDIARASRALLES
jgi:2-oxoisovalerate dehydrogenase E1 component